VSTALLAAVLVASSRHPRAPTVLLGEHLDMDAVCAEATAGARTMQQQQAALCSESLCGSTPAELAGTALAECSACGSTVNINLPGSLPYYYYYPPCVQSSYDPWEWYDYYYKYDPALAPYYEPWTPPDVDISIEAPGEEEEGAVEDAPEEAAEEDNEEDDNVVLSAYPRPHAQPAGTSTAGSFTMSNKRKPPRANTKASGYNVVPIGGHKFDADGDAIDGDMIFFDTSDFTQQPRRPAWK